MGSGASADVVQAAAGASPEQISEVFASLSVEDKEKIRAALTPPVLQAVAEDMSLATGDAYELKGDGQHVDGLFPKLKVLFTHMAKAQSDPEFKVDYGKFAATGEGFEHVKAFREQCLGQGPAWKLPECNPEDKQKLYNDQVTIENIGSIESPTIGGPDFHPDAKLTYGHIYKVKDKPSTNRPCLVYFHGGACIAGFPAILEHVLIRYAAQCDMTVITCGYRVAPEAPVPLAGKDAYAATKWVLANAETLGIDAKRVTVWGESGGSKTATSCAMNFADKNEGHLLKFFGAFACVTGNQYLRDGDNDGLYTHEKRGKEGQAAICKLFTPDFEAGMKDMWVYPNLMSDEFCKKMPPAVIFTGENCSTRSGSEEARDLYRRNGRLLAYGCLGGHNHVTWAFDLPGSDAHYDFVEQLVKKYLC